VEFLHLLLQRQGVHCFCLALDIHEALDDLLDCQETALVFVEKVEEALGLAGLDADRAEVRDDPSVPEQVAELILGELPGAVLVKVPEDAAHDLPELLLLLHLLLDGDGAVCLGGLHGSVDKDAGQDVEDTIQHEADVKHPQKAIPPT